MRTFRLLVIALVFLLHSAAGMAASVRICCLDAHCPVAECVAMGCIADPLPPAAVGAALQTAVSIMRETTMPDDPARGACPVEEIWTPPD